MNLASQAVQRIDSRGLSLNERALLRCQLAKELEDSGNYEAAREAMGEFWQRIGKRPHIKGLDQRATAEVLLRAGSLSGWIGSANQIDGAQESAKDLITKSATIFEKLQETEKVAEAYIDLAICYWREGAFDEARVTLQEALTRLSDENSEQRARALLNSAVIEISLNQFNDALNILKKATPLFEESQSQPAKGRFHNQLALVLKKLGVTEQREDYTDRALVEYAAASYHFEQAGQTRYRARVENNLGFLFLTKGKFTEAHEHLDRAHLLFTSLKDSGSAAQVDDTRARIFLAQKRNAEAEKISRGAVRTLEQGDEQALLAEALTTNGVALARLGRYEESRLTLERAIAIASQAGDNESAGVAALTIVEELSARLNIVEMTNLYERADEALANSQNSETLTRLRAVARHVLEAGRERVKKSAPPNFVYADEQTAELLRAAHRIASTQAPVLITGETGTGKELLARMIHEWSGRAGQFIAINCAALTEPLLESILFGHRKESVTDAAQDSAGAVRQAAGGTLFLDEIAELSLANQGKLLRLIEQGETYPLGAPAPERVDLRIIASTNHNLTEQVAERQFRDDLLYRLNTFHLEIPPLRKRPEDVSALAAQFAREFTERHNRHVSFTPEALEAMRRLPLRGNARELRSLIERTVLTAVEGTKITREAVEVIAARQTNHAALADAWAGCSFEEEVLRYEASLVKLALENSKGSVTRAARLLGVSHQRLCSMLQGRHTDLLPSKKPAQKRKRSIIKKRR
ncbi:MAG: two-component system, NtrC family, response regulator AtoC [Acidobacteriota bacterium]|jgi:transcriptional regulator with PAS, ATPase and Fis domain|nr:two-component system, NtrC family, response regulator AtoC [Acidobacteriota bacterium]